MFILNCQTPEYKDDLTNLIYLLQNGIQDKITGFREFIVEMPERYNHSSGRIFVNLIEKSFRGLIGKSLFNYFNPCVFLLFILSLCRFVGKTNSINILFIFSVVLLLFPFFAETCLWMSGSINYLWPCTAITIFLLYILYGKDREKNFWYYLWSIPCFFVGWTHESISGPLAFSLIVSLFIDKYNDRFKKILIFAFVLGALICFFAPGNFARLDNYGETITIKGRIGSGFYLFLRLKAFFILFATILLLYIYYVRKGEGYRWIRGFYRKNYIIVNALLFSFPFLFVSLYQAQRINTGPEFYSIILFLILLKNLPTQVIESIQFITIFAGTGLLIGIFHFSLLNYREVVFVDSQLSSHKSDVILYSRIKSPNFFQNYYLRPIEFSHISSDNTINPGRRRRYGYDKISFFPIDFYKMIIDDNLPLTENGQQDFPFYIIPLSDSVPFSDLGFYLSKQPNSTDKISLGNYQILKIKGKYYLFVLKNSDKKEIIDRLWEYSA